MKLLILLFLNISFFSCQEEFIPEPFIELDELVVDGHIEAGDVTRPPYVILTKKIPFYSEINRDIVNDIYVHDADIVISNKGKKYPLTEVCLGNLDPKEVIELDSLLGLGLYSLNICFYLDLSQELVGKEGERYNLDIQTNGQHLTSSTFIPYNVELDSLWFIDASGISDENLKNLRASISDPSGENYYRYFMRNDNDILQTSEKSIFSDQLVDGETFFFDLANPKPSNVPGTYKMGTKINLKWCSMDEDHFKFWDSLESNNLGPFSKSTVVSSNIYGGLGIWGGYSVSNYELIVQ